MALKRFDLYVPVSEDGWTTFAEVADVLDHLATLYAWHPDVYGFLITRACEARQIDSIYKETPHCSVCGERIPVEQQDEEINWCPKHPTAPNK